MIATPGSTRGAGKRVINMTSDLGSVSARWDATHALYHSPFEEYRISKAALNMARACAAYELGKKGVRVVAFNPGYTATDLTGDKEARQSRGARSVEEVADALVAVVLGARDGERGHMLNVQGTMGW